MVSRYRRSWSKWLLSLVSIGSIISTTARPRDEADDAERQILAQKVEEMYGHAFDSYMAHAFPADELRPLSCDGRLQRERGDLDAVLGNYSLTLIDSLDSLVIFSRLDDFERAVEFISTEVDFDKDIEVSTFELNIRALGGLLSGHLHAVRLLEGYTGKLLQKATDLASRLLPAFDTPTGMPLSRVNLNGTKVTSSNIVTMAEAGSFLLELGVLSLLTGNEQYYATAKRSLMAFWQRRSELDLVGTAADVNTGQFSDKKSTTGPGQDSFLEYMLKGYILFDDLELLEMFHRSFSAIDRYQSFGGFTYNVDMHKATLGNTHISPLSCVWGSLQVLLGDVAGGLRTVLHWFRVWEKFEALPEVFDLHTFAPTNARDSPLRPELSEAIYYLSLALPKDPRVLQMASAIIHALDKQSRVVCGFASVADVSSTPKRLDDRMDSFFLSETLVYLYLTVAPPDRLNQAPHWPLGEVVFSTEGHMFPLPRANVYAVRTIPGVYERSGILFPEASQRPMLTCEALSPFQRLTMQARCREMSIWFPPRSDASMVSHSSFACRAQAVSVTAAAGGDPLLSPLLELEGMVASFGPLPPVLPLRSPAASAPFGRGHRGGAGHVPQPLTFSGFGACGGNCSAGPGGAQWPGALAPQALALGIASLDLGGISSSPSLAVPGSGLLAAREFFARRSVVVANPLDACQPLLPPTFPQQVANEDRSAPASSFYDGRVVILARGSCLFTQKLIHVQQVSAFGALVINNGRSNELQVMSCPENGIGEDIHTMAIMISEEDGMAMLRLLQREGDLRVRIAAPA